MTTLAVRRRADEGAAFTSSKCPPGPGLENSCELPFGFVWTPMASTNKAVVIDCKGEALPPVLCLTCLAYMNPHSEVIRRTGVWTCPLCGQENVAPSKELKEGGLLHTALNEPFVEYHQTLSAASDEDEDSCTYVLVVDANLPKQDALGIIKAMESFVAENQQDGPQIKVGLIVFDDKISMYQLGLSGLASADVFTTSEDTEAAVQRRLGMEQRAYLVDVNTADDLASLYNCLSAVFGITTDDEAKPLSRKDILKKKKEARLLKEQLEQNGGTAKSGPVESPWVKRRQEPSHPRRCTGEAVQCALDLTALGETVSRTSRILLFTNGCPNAGDGSVVAESSEEPKKKHDVVDTDMLTKAVQYFDMTATFALESGIGFDVFCAGSNELGLPAYQALVAPCSGYVIPHLTFTTPQLESNLNFLLQNTFISRSAKSLESLDKKKKGDPATTDVIVDIRSDSFVVPTHMVGPGEIVQLNKTPVLDHERSAFATGATLAAGKGFKTNRLPNMEALDLSLTRIRIPRVDPLTTLAVMLQVNDSMDEDDTNSFFQMTSRHVDRTGRKVITRVFTHRFPVAEDVDDYVKGVDDEVVSTILAKAAVYRSLHGREESDNARDMTTAGDADTIEMLAYEAQLDLDATIQRISGSFRLLALESSAKGIDLNGGSNGDTSKAQSSLEKAFPPELTESLSRLYHLRRGPLISPGPMRSMDDRAETRGLFLRLPAEDCISMMAPVVYSSGNLEGISRPSGVMQPFPAESLTLWDCSIIAADLHDSLCVWSGKYCQGPQFDKVREKFKQSLLEESADRFPMPEFHMLYDGDSMSRRFTARLAPSHADSEDHQMANFPSLSKLSEEAMERLRSRFKFYDASADASFRTWFWSVASATNASKEDGMSLCE